MRSLAMTLLSTALLLPACDKSGPEAGGIAPPKDPAPAAITSAPAPTVTPATPVTTEPAPSSEAPAAAPPSSSGSQTRADAGKPRGGVAATQLVPASNHVSGNNFTLDLASPGCRVNEECTTTIKVVATGEYHVNKEYPYKFIAAPAPGVAFLGKTDPNLFTRASGDFVEQGEKSGLMTVRFKPQVPGEAKVAGKYKLSVCSADQCLIEEPLVDLTVRVVE